MTEGITLHVHSFNSIFNTWACVNIAAVHHQLHIVIILRYISYLNKEPLKKFLSWVKMLRKRVVWRQGGVDIISSPAQLSASEVFFLIVATTYITWIA